MSEAYIDVMQVTKTSARNEHKKVKWRTQRNKNRTQNALRAHRNETKRGACVAISERNAQGYEQALVEMHYM